ncbi:hypothetical protein [Microbispora sp. CA-102843]|uniref:hypothetical protein n=1 Tax=Microbispora sp. CA-102843 TaxID=3239952 RepID=UPI003D920B52
MGGTTPNSGWTTIAGHENPIQVRPRGGVAGHLPHCHDLEHEDLATDERIKGALMPDSHAFLTRMPYEPAAALTRAVES